jgi:uncharacterized membrane protein YqaE (UPF0057 family)
MGYNAYSTYDTVMHGGFVADDLCIPEKFFLTLVTIFFPPLGVTYRQFRAGFPNPIEIFISLILTAMFYFPGLIYSLNKINCGQELPDTTHYSNDSGNNAQEDVDNN